MRDTIDTKALRELLAKATPGPWRVNPVKGYTDDQIVTDHPDFQQSPHGNYVGETGLASGHKAHRYMADSALIVAAINALPALLDRSDELDRVKAELAAERRWRIQLEADLKDAP